jgi:hypothetical protein
MHPHDAKHGLHQIENVSSPSTGVMSPTVPGRPRMPPIPHVEGNLEINRLDFDLAFQVATDEAPTSDRPPMIRCAVSI